MLKVLSVAANLTAVVPLIASIMPLPRLLDEHRPSTAIVLLGGVWLVIAGWRRLPKPVHRLAVIALIVGVVSVPPALAHYYEYMTLRAITRPSAAARAFNAETSALLDGWMDGKAPMDPEKIAFMRYVLDRHAKVVSDELVRIFKLPGVPFLSVYVHSADRKRMLPVEGFGFSAYTLDGDASIAACTVRLRAVVFWSIRNGIKTWRMNGEEIGVYDVKSGRLKLDDGSTCAFDSASGVDPKNQLVCVPTNPDDTTSPPAKTAALCVAIDAASTRLDDPILHSYIIDRASRFGPYSLLAGLVAADKGTLDPTGAKDRKDVAPRRQAAPAGSAKDGVALFKRHVNGLVPAVVIQHPGS